MRRNPVSGRAVARQQTSRLRMQSGATRWWELSDQRLAHDRMHERERPPRRQQVSASQRVGGRLGTLAIKPAEFRCVAQRAARPEHRDRLRKSLAVNTEPRQPKQHGAPDRARA